MNNSVKVSIFKPLLIILISLSTLIVSFQTVNADSSMNHISNDKTWTNRLAKNGYVFQIVNNGNKFKNVLMKNNPNKVPVKYYSSKYVSYLSKKNFGFKIKNIWEYKNKVLYEIISKNSKYKGWVNSENLYNKNLNNKALSQFSKKEVDFTNNMLSIKKLDKELNKLSGRNKKIAKISLKEAKKYKLDQSEKNFPALFFANNPIT
ncbi:hypothetical protein GSH19_07095 [Lactobacillus sp. S2-2]|uniref:hypothetical protein n=1 Tax=Lactobacillus sp. S2-2 TaxID=2692917 RepID=UPI001F23211F|nr:hypothetical protein [Lactobacillus sp. S2-2]MCF6515909.1 hypothetical protein [Lactobacillus sp. S2-2]